MHYSHLLLYAPLCTTRTVTTWPYNMFHFPLVTKTHFCTCLSLSTNNTISLQCKWSLISVILNIFAQPICISLHVHIMIPSDTLTSPYWSSLLTPTSDTLWLHAAIDVLFLHSISLCARTHVDIFFSYIFLQINSYLVEMRFKQKEGKGLTCQRLKKNTDTTTDVSPCRLWLTLY